MFVKLLFKNFILNPYEYKQNVNPESAVRPRVFDFFSFSFPSFFCCFLAISLLISTFDWTLTQWEGPENEAQLSYFCSC